MPPVRIKASISVPSHPVVDISLLAGWTALHHAAVLCPPTLVSHLMTHGCSPFAETRRRLTPLDIVTAHTVLPGRDDIALLLEEAMRTQGWMGGRMEEKRRALDEQLKRKGRQKSVRENVSKVLGLQNQWWSSREEDEGFSSDDSDDEDDQFDEELYVSHVSSLKFHLRLPYLVMETPKLDFTSMLAWSPQELSHIFDAVITTSHTSVRNSQPAITLYLMARFACLTCDQTWLEDLVLGATDAIEEKFFVCILVTFLLSPLIQSLRAVQKILLVLYFVYTTPPYGCTSCNVTTL
jgi:hypothetical protein